MFRRRFIACFVAVLWLGAGTAVPGVAGQASGESSGRKDFKPSASQETEVYEQQLVLTMNSFYKAGFYYQTVSENPDVQTPAYNDRYPLRVEIIGQSGKNLQCLYLPDIYGFAPGKSEALTYFYSGSETSAVLRIRFGRENKISEAFIENVKITEVAPLEYERANLVLDGSFEKGGYAFWNYYGKRLVDKDILQIKASGKHLEVDEAAAADRAAMVQAAGREFCPEKFPKIEIDRSESAEGEQSLRIESGPETEVVLFYKNIPVVPGREYELSLWLKSSISNFPVHLAVDSGGPEWTDWMAIETFGATPGWKQYGFNFRIPETGRIMTGIVRLVVRGIAGKLWIDDVRVRAAGKSP